MRTSRRRRSGFCASTTPGRVSRAAVLAVLGASAAVAVLVGFSGCNHNSRSFFVPDSRAKASPSRQAKSLKPSPAAAWEVPEERARAWRYIVIHHSGTEVGSAAAFDRYHREVLGWKGLAYHFVIGNGRGTPDGFVEVSKRWKEQNTGAHAGLREYNQRGIGICLVGNFEEHPPTRAQMASLKRLLGWLRARFGIRPENFLRHKDIVPTICPGRCFPWSEVKQLVTSPSGAPR